MKTHSDNVDENVEDPPIFVFHDLLQNLRPEMFLLPVSWSERKMVVGGGEERQSGRRENGGGRFMAILSVTATIDFLGIGRGEGKRKSESL